MTLPPPPFCETEYLIVFSFYIHAFKKYLKLKVCFSRDLLDKKYYKFFLLLIGKIKKSTKKTFGTYFTFLYIAFYFDMFKSCTNNKKFFQNEYFIHIKWKFQSL